jgi:hypothetical protein
MKSRETTIKFIKEIIRNNKAINLHITIDTEGDTITGWSTKKELTPQQWKEIGYLSALSAAFDIKPEEIKEDLMTEYDTIMNKLDAEINKKQ